MTLNMRTKQEVISFLESKIGTKVKCIGNPSLDGQCVTLIKSLMEFLGVPDPYKARGNANTAISTYLKEGVADQGTGFLSVFSNKNMAGGYGHIWLNAGDGDGAFYESNGQKPLLVTKGKTYSYDTVCNFDKYIQKGEMAELKYTEKEMTAMREQRDDNWNKYQDAMKTAEKQQKEVATKQLKINELESTKTGLTNQVEDLEADIKALSDSLSGKDGEITTLNKQVDAYKGEVTKKETEIAELNAQLVEAQKPQGVLVGKRKLLAGALAPLLGIIAKIIFHYTGIEISTTELLGLASLPLAYVGMEGTADIMKLIKGTQGTENTDSKGINYTYAKLAD